MPTNKKKGSRVTVKKTTRKKSTEKTEPKKKTEKPSFSKAVVLARDVPERELEYLSNPWVPLGEMTLLMGEPAIGKSTFATHIAATIAENGAAERKTLFLSSEDYAEIIRGRLKANSADPEKAPALDQVMVIDDWATEATYPHSVLELQAMVEEVEEEMGKICLVVLDPILNFLGCGTNTYAKARTELQALRQWCRASRTAVIGVIHKTKNGNSMRGSGAYLEVARNVIGIRPKGSSKVIRTLYHEKCSFDKPSPERDFCLGGGKILWAADSGER